MKEPSTCCIGDWKWTDRGVYFASYRSGACWSELCLSVTALTYRGFQRLSQTFLCKYHIALENTRLFSKYLD